MFRRFSLSDPTQQFMGLTVPSHKHRPEIILNSVNDRRKSRSLNTSPTPIQKKKKDLDVVYANPKKKISLPDISNSLGGKYCGQNRRKSTIIRRNYGDFYRAGVSLYQKIEILLKAFNFLKLIRCNLKSSTLTVKTGF